MRAQLTLSSDKRTGTLRGVLWALLASLALTVMLMLVKLLGRSVPVSQILLVRQAVIILLLAPFIAPRFLETFATKRIKLHVLRAILAATAMLAGYTAIEHLPLADFTALSFSRAFFLTLLAAVILKESVSLRRWSATFVGFAGVLLILGPGTSSFTPYALLVLFGAFATALIFVIVRSLTVSEAPLTIVSFQATLVGLLVLPLALIDWAPLTLDEWMLALGIGVTGLLAQLSTIRALKAAPASVTAPTDYVRLVWAMLIGFLVFSELPTFYSIFGASLIVVAAFWVLTEKKADAE